MFSLFHVCQVQYWRLELMVGDIYQHCILTVKTDIVTSVIICLIYLVRNVAQW